MDNEKLKDIIEKIENNKHNTFILKSDMLVSVLMELMFKYYVESPNSDEDSIFKDKYYVLDTERINKDKFKISFVETEETALC